jgi:hypothetical protein
MKFYFSPEEVRAVNLRATQFIRAQDEAKRTGKPLDFPMTKSLEFCLRFARENYSREDYRRAWDAALRTLDGRN